jgi:hypothetical protein
MFETTNENTKKLKESLVYSLSFVVMPLLMLCTLVHHGCVLMKENKRKIMLDQLRQTILIKNKRNDTLIPH